MKSIFLDLNIQLLVRNVNLLLENYEAEIILKQK